MTEQYDQQAEALAARYESLRPEEVHAALLDLLPLRAEQRIATMGLVNGFDYAGAKILYRPPNIGLTSNSAGVKRIDLEW